LGAAKWWRGISLPTDTLPRPVTNEK